MARGFYRRWDHNLPSRADRLTLEAAAIRRPYRLRSRSKDLYGKRRVKWCDGPAGVIWKGVMAGEPRVGPTLAQIPNFFYTGLRSY
jgi:hypothetical protein